MKTKLILPVFLALFLVFGCKNNETPESEKELEDAQFSPTANEISRKDTVGRAEDTPPATETEQSGNTNTVASGNTTVPQGRYIKKDEQGDNNCGCYCIEIDFTSTSELCLTPKSMYISTRMEKGEGNTINLFFVEPSTRNTEGEDIPWQDFDKNTPIATLSPQNNGEVELDWLGFSINGDLAMDYAIYGKKTLEGTYKKK